MWNRVGGDNGSLFGTTRVGFRHPFLTCVASAPVTPMERQYSGVFFIGNNNGECIERSEVALQQASATARGEATKR